MPQKTIGFKPIKKGDFSAFFSVGTAYGKMALTQKEMNISLLYGTLDLKSLIIPDENIAKALIIDGENIRFEQDGDKLNFDESIAKERIEIIF